MIKSFIYFLIILYPIISLLPRELILPNIIWGFLIILLLIFDFLINYRLNQGNLKINLFNKVGLIFIFFMLISVIFSGDINFNKLYAIIKFVLPLFIAAYLYKNISTDNLFLLKIYRITGIYIIVFLIFIFYRLNFVGYNIFLVMANRTEVWYDKPYIIAIAYSSVLLLFLYLSYILKKNNKFQILLLLPVYYFGSRTAMIAITLFLIFLLIIEFKGIIRFFLLNLGLILFIYILYNDTLQENIENSTTQLFLSETNAKYENMDITEKSFTSGRNEIYQYYFDNLSLNNFIQGNGIAYFNSKSNFNFRLHNDVLEFFFSFGIVGFFFFLYFIYYKLLIKTILNAYKIERLFLIGLFLFFTGLSLFTSIMDYQNIIYLYLIIAISIKLNYKENKNAISDSLQQTHLQTNY